MDSVIHPLKTWIEANTSQADFARACGITPAYLSEIINKGKEPSLKLAARMSRETSGTVSVEAFVNEVQASRCAS